LESAEVTAVIVLSVNHYKKGGC